MDSLGNILYLCTLLHIICEHLHDLYTLNSLSGLKGLKKFIPRDCFNSSLYIPFSMIITLNVKKLKNVSYKDKKLYSKYAGLVPKDAPEAAEYPSIYFYLDILNIG